MAAKKKAKGAKSVRTKKKASKKKASKKKASKKKASKKKASKKKASKKKASKKKASKKKVSKKKASKKKVSKKKASKRQASKRTAAPVQQVPAVAQNPEDPEEIAASGGPDTDASGDRDSDQAGAASAESSGAAEPNRSEEAAMELAEGEKLPDFELPDQDGDTVRAGDLLGEPFVLYFYPKDDTPGCTKQACGFQDELTGFSELGVRVVGVSPDKPETHVKFRDKYGLNFTLLSDVEKKLAGRLGVWKLKKNYGREYMGIERSTFLVDGQGVIKKSWRAVRVAGHVPEVLSAAKSL